jgi:acyl-coenzyme A thioesterase PaaI-like protein
VANAHVLHRTGRTASVQVRVTDEQGLLHAQAMGTVVVSQQAHVAG